MGVAAGQHQSFNNKPNTGQPGASSSNRARSWVIADGHDRNTMASCESCSIRFSFLKKKRRCSDCARLFCSSCTSHKLQGDLRRCNQCQSVVNGDFSRNDLLLMKVSHLRTFLSAKNIPTASCTEKTDLIDLVLEHFGSVGYHRTQFEHGREINRLAEKMRETNEVEGPPRSTYEQSQSDLDQSNPTDGERIVILDSEEEDEMIDDVPQNDPLTGNYTVVDATNPMRSNETEYTNDSQPGNAMHSETVSTTETAQSQNHTTNTGAHTSASRPHSIHITESVPHSHTVPNEPSIPHSPSAPTLNNSHNTNVPNTTVTGDTADVLTDTERLRERRAEEMAATEARLRIDLDNENRTTETRQPITRKRIEDIASADELAELTVRQLKELLVGNFVDYKGCCERWELEDRVRRLWHEKQANNQTAEEARLRDENVCGTEPIDYDVDICKICMDAAINCVLLECGHMVTCTSCGKQLAECPICRQYVSRVVHTFKA